MLICNFIARTCFTIFAIDSNLPVLNLVLVFFALFANFDTKRSRKEAKIEKRIIEMCLEYYIFHPLPGSDAYFYKINFKVFVSFCTVCILFLIKF
jgi:hypothetical protein